MKLRLLLVFILIVSCSATDAIEETVVGTTVSTTTTTIAVSDSTTTTEAVISYEFDIERMSPLTGKEIPPELWLNRPKRVLAFKIDNNINARPQSGLQEADSVFEILVEGGMTRFLAFFLDNTSKYLGPIRSARPTDPTVVRPYDGTLVVSGATDGLIPTIRELGVPVLEEVTAPAMFRIGSRKAPHNLYADTELVREVVDSRGFKFLQPGPQPLYPFGFNQNNWVSGANKITIQYSEFTTVIWKLDGNRYSRFIIDAYSNDKNAVAHNFISQDGNYSDILSTETIVVIQGALYKDKATTLPSILTVGIGDLFIFNDGKYVQGNWRRTDISENFEFFDLNQNPIEVPPSSQWIHIVPNEGQITWSNS
ncbi:DUF3048 domain-containing protein [Acidimicrobiaceae bacterium]|nr:DUF3048 domain-containing protein [Acidimicrobiaceae bacterium]